MTSAADQALVPTDQLPRDFEALTEKNQALGSELLRCYEQLSFVFEIAEHIGNLQDPAAIRNALLRRCATMLNAGALFFDHAGRCVPITCGETTARPVEVDAERLQATLAQEIEAVRRTGRSRAANLTPAARPAWSSPCATGASRPSTRETPWPYRRFSATAATSSATC